LIFSIVSQNEVTSLKTLLDTGSASSSSGFGHGSSEEDDDEKEIISQKEIIIARDQVSSIKHDELPKASDLSRIFFPKLKLHRIVSFMHSLYETIK
jgi:hypothetical protein